MLWACVLRSPFSLSTPFAEEITRPEEKEMEVGAFIMKTKSEAQRALRSSRFRASPHPPTSFLLLLFLLLAELNSSPASKGPSLSFLFPSRPPLPRKAPFVMPPLSLLLLYGCL